MRITRKMIETLLVEIGAATNQPTSEAQAIEMGKDFYLFLEYASCYGGYRIVNVKVKGGAHYGAFGGNGTEARLSASKMWDRLSGILTGLEMASITE